MPINMVSRRRRVFQLYQQIWKYWQRDYLSKLQERKKWKSNKSTLIKVGTVWYSIMKEDSVPPSI